MLRLGLALAAAADPKLTPARIMRRAKVDAGELRRAIAGQPISQKKMLAIADAIGVGARGLGLEE